MVRAPVNMTKKKRERERKKKCEKNQKVNALSLSLEKKQENKVKWVFNLYLIGRKIFFRNQFR